MPRGCAITKPGFAVFNSVKKLHIEKSESITPRQIIMVCYTEALLGSKLTRWSSHIVNAASVAPSFKVASPALGFASKYTMLSFSQQLTMNCGWKEYVWR